MGGRAKEWVGSLKMPDSFLLHTPCLIWRALRRRQPAGQMDPFKQQLSQPNQYITPIFHSSPLSSFHEKLLPALFLTASLGGAATTAQAQSTIEFAPRLGLNLSTVLNSGTPSGFNEETKSIAGLQVGGTLSVGIGHNLSFQPSLLFSQKGAEFRASNTDRNNPPYVTSFAATATPKLNYLELPLNFVYTVGGTEGIQFFAGPYVAAGVSGSGSFKVDIKSDDPDVIAFGAVGSYPGTLTVEYANRQNDNANNPNNPNSLNLTVRRFDAGLNAGMGYRVGPFQAQLGYGLGMVNFVPKDSNGNDTGSKSYHRVLQLSANYFLGGK